MSAPVFELGLAQEAPSGESSSPLIGRVGTHLIYEDDVKFRFEALPLAQKSQGYPKLYKELLNRVIEYKLLAERAEQLQLDAQLADDLRRARENILVAALLSEIIRQRRTPAMVQAEYERLAATTAELHEYRVRRLMVADRRLAIRLAGHIEDGDSFEELAQAYSLVEPGDAARWLQGSEVSEPLREILDALRPNQVSAEPLRTRRGWLLVQLLERRPHGKPDFETLEPYVYRNLDEKIIQTYTRELVKTADIEIY